jgi:hypothetical protein
MSSSRSEFKAVGGMRWTVSDLRSHLQIIAKMLTLGVYSDKSEPAATSDTPHPWGD